MSSISFKADSSLFSAALTSVQKIIGDATLEVVDVVFGKDSIRMTAANPVKAISVSRSIPYAERPNTKKGLSAAVNAPVLSGVCANRGEMSFVVEVGDKNEMSFKASKGRYAGTSKLESPLGVDSPIPQEIREGESVKFGDEFRQIFLTTLTSISLTDLSLGVGELEANIRVKNKHMEVVVADVYHGVYVDIPLGKNAPKNIEAHFPLRYVSTIKDFFLGEKSFSLSITDTTIYAWNDNVELALPLLKADRLHTIDEFKAEAFDDIKTVCSYVIKPTSLKQMIDNSMSIFVGDSIIELTCTDKGMRLKAKSEVGTLSEGIPVEAVKKAPKKDYTVSLDANHAADVLSKIPSTSSVRFSLVESGPEGKRAMYDCSSETAKRIFIVGVFAAKD